MAGIQWRGHRACRCVINATLDYERRRSPLRRIFQAGYSFASASAGTHAKGGALDTNSLSDGDIKAASAIGFWPSNRYQNEGFDPHAHWVLFGCPHMPPGLKYQESELRDGRGGLNSGRADKFRSLRPGRILTYAAWKRQQDDEKPPGKTIVIHGKRYPDPGNLSVSRINTARRTGAFSVDIYRVQWLLIKEGYYERRLHDGKWGKVSQAALFRLRKGKWRWSNKASHGAMTMTTLERMKKEVGTTGWRLVK